MVTMTHSLRRRRSSLGVPRGLIVESMDRESLLIEAIRNRVPSAVTARCELGP